MKKNVKIIFIKSIIVLNILFVIVCLNNYVLLADSNLKESKVSLLCDETVDLSSVEMIVSLVNEQKEIFNENSFFKYSNDLFEKRIYTNNKGEVKFYIEDGKYSLYIVEETLSSDIYIDELYYEFNAGDELNIVVHKYNNIENSAKTKSINEILTLGVQRSAIDMDYEMLLNEFQEEYIVNLNGFKIYSYKNNLTITTSILNNIVNEFINIRDYFCNINGFPIPRTIEQSITNPNGIMEIFIIDLSNAEGVSNPVIPGNSLSFICLDPDAILESKIKFVAAHEYFHCIQRAYLENSQSNFSTSMFFSEGTAEMAGLIYASLQNLSQQEEAEFIRRVSYQSSLFFRRGVEGLYYENENYSYMCFVFHLFIYEKYGGYEIIQNFYTLYLNQENQLTKSEQLELYALIIKNKMNFEEYNFEDLYNEFIEYCVFANEKFDLNGYGENIINEAANTVSLPFNDSYPFEKTSDENKETQIFIESYGFFVYRIDSRQYSYLEQRFVFTSINTLSEISDGLRVKVYSKNSSGNWLERNYNNNNSTNINTVDFSIGNGTNKAYIIVLYNVGEEVMEIKYHYVNRYYPFGDCLYAIEVMNEMQTKKYISYMLDEMNCISDNCNVFLSENTLSVSNKYCQTIQFWIKKENDYFIIKPNADPYYDSTCEDFLLSSSSDGNVSLKCNTYSSYNREWLLEQVLLDNSFAHLYIIKERNNSSLHISYSTFANGNNNGTQITSLGNVIVSQNTQKNLWRFIGAYNG